MLCVVEGPDRRGSDGRAGDGAATGAAVGVMKGGACLEAKGYAVK
jgi:hypothetical protein